MKNGNISVSVDPNIKREAEAILKRLDVSTSKLINELYLQIILTNNIPFQLTIPTGVQSLNTLTDEELDEMINKSLNQAINGESIPLDEAIESIRNEKN